MLNFDPYRFVMEQQGEGVATVASVAGVEGKVEKSLPLENKKESKNASFHHRAATVATPATNGGGLYHGWRRALLRLDPCQPPEGFDPARWITLYDCSVWWLDNYAKKAAAHGWGTGDIFGLHPAGPKHGGVIDKFSAGLCYLRDRPGLSMDASRATWKSWGIVATYGRGAGDGLKAFWELNDG